jgi:hypothetical protein
MKGISDHMMGRRLPVSVVSPVEEMEMMGVVVQTAKMKWLDRLCRLSS